MCAFSLCVLPHCNQNHNMTISCMLVCLCLQICCLQSAKESVCDEAIQHVYWQDDEGDLCMCSNNEEFQEALRVSGKTGSDGEVFILYVCIHARSFGEMIS